MAAGSSCRQSALRCEFGMPRILAAADNSKVDECAFLVRMCSAALTDRSQVSAYQGISFACALNDGIDLCSRMWSWH